MENLELELMETLNIKNSKRENYKIGNYAVYVYYECGIFKDIAVKNLDRDGYTPDIYFKGEWFGEVKNEFKIQTTAYGALAPEEIPGVIKGYEVAMNVVELLTQTFL